VELRPIILGAVETAFGVAGDVLESATLHLGKTQDYDIDTDESVETGGQDVPVSGVWFKDKQVQTQITGGDASFMVKGSNAPDGIDEADSLTFTSGPRTGEKWNIYQVNTLPAGAGYILWIRR